jgi:hypothetical protein
MVWPACLLALLAVAGSGVSWTRDYVRAFAGSEEQRRPVLLFFRDNCGGGNRPQNPIDVGGPIEHQEGLSSCDLMQQDVWEDQAVVAATGRFTPLVVDGGDQTLEVRYQVIRTPTTLVTDPWGNEILRVSGYYERAKMLRFLGAVPNDFAPLATSAQVLKQNGADFGALTSAAAFYQERGLPQVVERLYSLALNTPRSSVPVQTWRQAVIARGLNLLAGLNNPEAAAGVFQQEWAAGPGDAGSDALLLGVVNARLQQGKRSEAAAAVKTLEQKHPGSPYTKRARQVLDTKPSGS